MAGKEKAGNMGIDNNGLNDIVIEIECRNALIVAAALDLGGLAVSRFKRKPLSRRDSDIFEKELRKLNNI